MPFRRGSSGRLAFIAALLLVFQTLGASLALGAAASAPLLDAWGNPICATSADGTPAHEGDGSKLPPCCTLNCPMVSVPLGPAPQMGASLILPRTAVLDASRHVRAVFVARTAKHHPGNPRAPPLTV